MYTLLVCADLYGEKVNLEITFAAMPTIGELQRKIVEVFGAEAQVKRPQGYPAIDFQIARLQVYDDVLLKWADLVTATQLHEYDQLYAFQPQSPWHIDVQKDLPPPRPPTATATRAPPQAPHTPATYDTPYQPGRSGPTGAYGGTPSHHHPSQQHSTSSGPAAHQYSPATPHGVSHINSSNLGGGATGGRGRSPVIDRLEQNRSREEMLRQELARIAEENAKLEREAEQEREMERRRMAAQQEETLRARELEIQRQREALRQMEEEYQREQQRLRGR